MIPYGRQIIDDDDIRAVVEVLKSDWLTTGPKIAEFEQAFAESVGARHAVAFASGTAALHGAAFALDIRPGDEVVLPPMTFAATANVVVYQGGTPRFADVERDTLLIDCAGLADQITARTRAVIAVDYAGQPCDYDRLREICNQRGLPLVADACHALGGSFRGHPAGSLADLNVFSFHPVKHITAGEGGMVTTDDAEYATRMRRFRNHGITSDHHERAREGGWFYEMIDLGYNYRITDFQCALAHSQLRKLPAWVARRQAIARHYDEALAADERIAPLAVRPEVSHAYHLYVVRLDTQRHGITRADLFAGLRQRGIGANVHYIPVHLHPYYQERFGYGPGLCPVAEAAYEEIISLPMYAGLRDEDVDRVIAATRTVLTDLQAERSRRH